MQETQAKLLKALNKIPYVIAFSINQDAISLRGLPDVVVLHQGKAIFCEVKRINEAIRPDQHYMMAKLVKVGCHCCVIRCDEDIENFVQRFENIYCEKFI